MKRYAGLALALALAGCISVEEAGLQYRLERGYWNAARELAQLRASRTATAAQVDRVRMEFLGVAELGRGAGEKLPSVKRVMAQSYLQNYDLLAGLGHKDEAAKALEQLLADYAADSMVTGEALWRRANSRSNAGDSAGALEDFRRVLTLVQPNLAAPQSVAGHVLDIPLSLVRYRVRGGPKALAAEEAQSALQYYYDIVARYGHAREGFAARAYVGDLYTALGNPARALAVLDSLQADSRAVPEENQRRPQMLLRLAAMSADQLGDLNRANAYLDKLGHDYPKSNLRGTMELMRGRLFARQQRNDESAKTFRQTAEDASLTDEVRAAAWLELARLSELQNNWEEAQRSYGEASTNFPLTADGMRAPLAVAAHYVQAKDAAGTRKAWEDARKFYEGIISRYPESARTQDARKFLLRALSELQDWKAAVTLLGQIADRGGQSRPALEAMLLSAEIHEQKLGDKKAAIADLQMVLQRFPKAPFRAQVEAQLKRLGG